MPRVTEAEGQSPKFHPGLPGSQAWTPLQDPALMTCLTQSWGQGADRLEQEQGVGAGGGTWTRSSCPDPPVCETASPTIALHSLTRCWPLTQSACGRYCSLWVTRTTVLLSSRSSSRIPACIRWSLRWTSRAEKGSSWVDGRKQGQAWGWVTVDVKTLDVHAVV